jgi:CBS domain containing-hemolysin-like protein
MSVVISSVFSFVSSTVLDGAGYIPVAIALIIFIGLGVVFDIVGIAVAAARETPFHAMASHHERGAKEAIWLIRNANKVSSICNDVVGDICGIVSGTTAALIVARLVSTFSIGEVMTNLVISAAVTGLTIGGKGVGKQIAMTKTTSILLRTGRLVSIFKRRSK